MRSSDPILLVPLIQKMLTPREKFQELLKKLFQFDSAELDFGIYRIMNHKRAVIENFIEKDLMIAVTQGLEAGALAQQSTLADRLAKTVKQVKDKLGSEALDAEGTLDPIYEKTPLGKEYLKLYASAASAKNRPELEAEIFNHLYAFFSRYYDEGDFMSLRRYSKREKYAIPYNGEEVFLHWANSDQYYIKTGENFTDYSYTHGNFKIRFKLRNADVEQNNVKGAKRFFVPRVEDVAIDNDLREIMIPFDFRPITSEEETLLGKAKLQEAILTEAVPIIFERAKANTDALSALAHEKRRDSDGSPVSLLDHHLRIYTKKNSTDFFIHKDLKGFLERELDFYIKNEVLNLDELEASGESRTEGWFQILNTIKSIGRKIIAFVSQIEDFQKRLFEKKKFVTEVNYCVTLDRVPRELFAEIAANRQQRDEWVKLLAIDQIEKDLSNPGYSVPLTTEFLVANSFLPLDTKFFAHEFVDKLLATVDDVDSELDGGCIRSENFQALRLVHDYFREQLRCIYIDPPYNTDAGPILYKNGYRSSSFTSLLADRLGAAKLLLSDDGIICVTIDDYQVHELAYLLDKFFTRENQLGVAVIRNNPSGRSTVTGFSVCHEYAFFYRRTNEGALGRFPRTEKQLQRFTEEAGIHVDWRNFRKDGGAVTHRNARPKQFYPIYVNVSAKTLRIPKLSWKKTEKQWDILEEPAEGEVEILPIDEKGKERVWSLNHISARNDIEDLEVRINKGGGVQVFRRHIPSRGVLPRSWWDKKTYAAREYGSAALTDLFGESSVFSFAKSPFAVQDCIWVAGLDYESTDWVLDFFAGSGTTGHAVLNLNREDGGERKFLLVEIEEYFDSVLMPRLKKVIYSDEWREGKPISRKGSSCFLKYLHLESYEDALDNIAFQPANEGLLKMDEYVLSYMLDFETKDSATLLDVAQMDSPFDYTLYRHGQDDPLPVDLPETFNFLIGLHVKTRKVLENKGVRYLVYRGKSGDNETVVIWRTTRGWGQIEFEADRAFIAKQKITDGAQDVFVNTDSFVPNARSLDPLFKRRMFNEE